MLCCMGATRTQIYLSEEQREQLDRRRRREGKTLAALVREAVDAYLELGRGQDFRDAVEATFGSIADLEVPPRAEWDRGHG